MHKSGKIHEHDSFQRPCHGFQYGQWILLLQMVEQTIVQESHTSHINPNSLSSLVMTRTSAYETHNPVSYRVPSNRDVFSTKL